MTNSNEVIIDKDIIDFFTKNNLYDEKMFDYFYNNTIMIDSENHNQIASSGCFPILGRHNILRDFKLYLPYTYNLYNKLTVINVLVHGVIMYKNLNKHFKINNKNNDILSMMYEKIYVEEKDNKYLKDYSEFFDNHISVEDQKYDKILKLRDELKKDYIPDFDKMQKKAKYLVRKNKNN